MASKNDQDQVVNENSLANQAGGDISQNVMIVGCSYSEVKEICLDLFKKNADELAQVAQHKAVQEVESYAEILYSQLSQELSETINERLQEPEIQAAINDTVKIVARKGPRSNKELLSQLIKDKIAKFHDEEESGIIDDAIDVMQKISTSQIILFSLIYAIRDLFVSIKNKKYSELEMEGFPLDNVTDSLNRPINSSTLPLEDRKEITSRLMRSLYITHYDNGDIFKSLNIEGISRVNVDLIQSRGLILSDKTFTKSTIEIIKSQWGASEDENIDDLLPNLLSIIKKLGMNSFSDLDKFVPTPISRHIGLSYISSRVKIVRL